MGCLSNRTAQFAEEEKQLVAYENSLGFSRFGAEYVDRVFHRYSMDLKMSMSQFSKACIELSINEGAEKTFFNNFYYQEKYKMKEMCTMAIVLSNSPVEEKLKILFQNYDNDVSWSLSANEIKEMLRDISQVACEFIPYSVLSGSHEYTKILKEIKKCISSQLVAFWMEESKEITFEQFVHGVKVNSSLAAVLNFSQLRRYCVETREKYIRTVKFAIETLERKQDFEDLVGDSSQLRKKKPRRKSRRNLSNKF